jgi:hypothetical protein
MLDSAPHKRVRHASPALWAAHFILAGLFARQARTRRVLGNRAVGGMVLAVRGLLFPALWLGNVLGAIA